MTTLSVAKSPYTVSIRSRGRSAPLAREQPMPAAKPTRQSAKGAERPNLEVLSAPNALDRVDREIISLLQRDGRRAYGAIAEEVGLSEAAVRRRVQRLREHGVIQIVAVTDPLQLGFNRQAMVGIRAEGDAREVAAKVAALDEVDYVVMCAGSFDVLAEVVCEDD